MHTTVIPTILRGFVPMILEILCQAGQRPQENSLGRKYLITPTLRGFEFYDF